MNNDILFLSSKNHPLRLILEKYHRENKLRHLDHEESQVHSAKVIFDFTLLTTKSKKSMYRHFLKSGVQSVFAEGSCVWGDALISEFPFLKGLFSLAFPNPQNKFEYYLRPDMSQDHPHIAFLFQLFSENSLIGIPVSSPGIGFTLPRILSTIINESYFALGENLCSKEDMDLAMRTGVNYPWGPMEWLEKIGADKVVLLLQELYKATGETRYRTHPNLKLSAIKAVNA